MLFPQSWRPAEKAPLPVSTPRPGLSLDLASDWSESLGFPHGGVALGQSDVQGCSAIGQKSFYSWIFLLLLFFIVDGKSFKIIASLGPGLMMISSI